MTRHKLSLGVWSFLQSQARRWYGVFAIIAFLGIFGNIMWTLGAHIIEGGLDGRAAYRVLSGVHPLAPVKVILLFVLVIPVLHLTNLSCCVLALAMPAGRKIFIQVMTILAGIPVLLIASSLWSMIKPFLGGPSLMTSALLALAAVFCLAPTSIAITWQLFDGAKKVLPAGRALGLSSEYIYSRIVFRECRSQYVMGLIIAVARGCAECAVLINMAGVEANLLSLSDQTLYDFANTLITRVRLDNNLVLVAAIIVLALIGKTFFLGGTSLFRPAQSS